MLDLTTDAQRTGDRTTSNAKCNKPPRITVVRPAAAMLVSQGRKVFTRPQPRPYG